MTKRWSPFLLYMFVTALLLAVSGAAGWAGGNHHFSVSHCAEMDMPSMPHQGGVADHDLQLCCAGHCLASLPFTLTAVVIQRAVEPQVAAPSDLTSSQHWPPLLRPPRSSQA